MILVKMNHYIFGNKSELVREELGKSKEIETDAAGHASYKSLAAPMTSSWQLI